MSSSTWQPSSIKITPISNSNQLSSQDRNSNGVVYYCCCYCYPLLLQLLSNSFTKTIYLSPHSVCCVLWGKLDDDDTIGFVEEKEENDDDININWVTIDAMSNHMRLDQLPCKSSPYLSFDFRRDALLCSLLTSWYIYTEKGKWRVMMMSV